MSFSQCVFCVVCELILSLYRYVYSVHDYSWKVCCMPIADTRTLVPNRLNYGMENMTNSASSLLCSSRSLSHTHSHTVWMYLCFILLFFFSFLICFSIVTTTRCIHESETKGANSRWSLFLFPSLSWFPTLRSGFPHLHGFAACMGSAMCMHPYTVIFPR